VIDMVARGHRKERSTSGAVCRSDRVAQAVAAVGDRRQGGVVVTWHCLPRTQSSSRTQPSGPLSTCPSQLDPQLAALNLPLQCLPTPCKRACGLRAHIGEQKGGCLQDPFFRHYKCHKCHKCHPRTLRSLVLVCIPPVQIPKSNLRVHTHNLSP